MKTVFDISWRAITKVLVTVALVWVWLQLWHFVMVILASIIMAVALYPAVHWLEKRGLPKGIGALAIVLLLVAISAAMVAASWVAIRDQSRLIVERLNTLSDQLSTSFPLAEKILPAGGTGQGDGLTQYAVRIMQSASGALGLIVLALVVTVYLLIEWQRTLEWLLAFVPQRHRARVQRTLDEARDVAYRYAIGNVIASTVTGVATYVVLAAMSVPAALVLALLSAALNIIPIIGFLISSVIAAVVAASVSLNALILVVAFYLVFNVIENYLITPKVFGHELELSELAVLVAVIVGAELGGVMGAILALPMAAVYPTVERIWLRERLSGDTVEIHQRLSA